MAWRLMGYIVLQVIFKMIWILFKDNLVKQNNVSGVRFWFLERFELVGKPFWIINLEGFY
jgi:hypothetical protein